MRVFLFSVLLTLMGSASFAERMSGQEVANLMSQGTIQFQAGSVWQTLPNGRYVFNHRNSGEEGTFQIFQNGEVRLVDEGSNRTIRFYFDRGDDGVPALIYLTGSSAGNRYPIK